MIKVKYFPNILTFLRIVLIPVFLVWLFWDESWRSLWLVVLFSFICATDFLDGFLARKFNAESHIGKVLDPIADKLLVISTLIALIYLEIAAFIPACIIIAREIIVSILREWIKYKNKPYLESSLLGKLKTTSQLLSLFLLLNYIVDKSQHWLYQSGEVTLWIAAALSLWSMMSYIMVCFRR